MSEQSDNVFKLPESKCPSCGMTIEFTSHLQNGGKPSRIGDIIICSGCATICKLDPLGLYKMKKEELDALDAQSKGIITLAIASVRHQQIAGQGRG